MLRDLFSLFPAYAGVILLQAQSSLLRIPFPRIRGGDPQVMQYLKGAYQLFPAYAGVIPQGKYGTVGYISFPRIRGGDPSCSTELQQSSVFSPHTRG